MRSESFYKLHKELNHIVTMHGQACINGDKDGAKRFMESLKDTFEELDMLTRDLERAENQEELRASLLADIVEENEIG